MVQMVGKYVLERNENLDGYFKAIGVPYIARKMMAVSTPVLEITCNEDKYTLKTTTTFRTVEFSFKSDEEYDEVMPSGDVLKSKTKVEDDKMVTESIIPDGSKTIRTYEFSDEGVVLTLAHEKSGQTAKRYFKKM